MAWVEIVTCLALIQYLVFGSLVAKARGQYGVKAPAVTGHEMFERFYRVQMNTLELFPVLLVGLFMAATAAFAQATPTGLWKTIDDDGKTLSHLDQADIVLVGILLYAILGKLADVLARGLERYLLRWHAGYQK